MLELPLLAAGICTHYQGTVRVHTFTRMTGVMPRMSARKAMKKMPRVLPLCGGAMARNQPGSAMGLQMVAQISPFARLASGRHHDWPACTKSAMPCAVPCQAATA